MRASALAASSRMRASRGARARSVRVARFTVRTPSADSIHGTRYAEAAVKASETAITPAHHERSLIPLPPAAAAIGRAAGAALRGASADPGLLEAQLERGQRRRAVDVRLHPIASDLVAEHD